MSDDLSKLERQLEKLEAEVVQEYDRLQLAAAAQPNQRVVIPEEKLEVFTREMWRLQNSLYATGEVKVLRLVSEHHDALRIRMIFLQHLLEREIPRPYVDEVMQDFSKAPRHGSGRVPQASTPSPAAAKPSLLGRVFQREPAKPAPPAPTPARATGNDVRLIYLHKLMEEDRMNLLKPSERPPQVAQEIRTPDFIAQFTARDFAEAHLGTRAQRPAEKIARTPEELRAKLAQREKSQDGKEPK